MIAGRQVRASWRSPARDGRQLVNAGHSGRVKGVEPDAGSLTSVRTQSMKLATFLILSALGLDARAQAVVPRPSSDTGSSGRLEKPAPSGPTGATGPTNRLERASAPAPPPPVVEKGAKWRHPETYAPAVGPALLEITTQQAAPIVDASRRKDKSLPMPEVQVLVLDKTGKPVPGVEVRVGLKGTKKNTKALRLKGATDAAGGFTLRPAASLPMQRVAIDLAWDGGYKVLGVDLEPDDGKWDIESAPIKNSVTGDDEGSCRNLFRLDPAASAAPGRPAFRLTLSLPTTLLECKRVEYGNGSKSDEMAQVNAIGSRDINDGDKNLFSEDDESQMGVEASKHFDAQLERISDPAITSYVKSVMDRVVAASDAPGTAINLRVVHMDAVNAFATAGGNVYVFTGLIAAAENESQLAGVLAHEFSHVVARHVTEGATRQMKTQIGTAIGAAVLGSVAGLSSAGTETLMRGSLTAAGIYSLKFDRRLETEADLIGEQYLWKAGWDPEAIARFFEVLERESKGEPPAWLSTHPPHEHRIANGVHWARAFLPPKDRYLVDTQAFQDCKARVKALPPPKKPRTQ